MRRFRRSAPSVIVGLILTLILFTSWNGPSTLRQGSGQAWLRTGLADAQELIFVKVLEEAEKAIQEARDFEAEIYAPDEYALALYYLAQAKDEAKTFRSAAKATPEAHLLSARQAGEAISLLAEKAQYQAKVAGSKAIEVKSDREIIAIKAQVADTFNTDVNRRFTSTREELLGELGTKEAVRNEARRTRAQAESELRKLKLTVEGEVKPAPR